MQLKKKRGFTLIELMVAITCAIVLLGALSASLFSVISLSSSVMHDSASDFQIVTVRDYILQNPTIEFKQADQVAPAGLYLWIDEDHNIFSHDGSIEKRIVTDSIIDNIVFYTDTKADDKKFKVCTFEFLTKEKRNPLSFVVAEV